MKSDLALQLGRYQTIGELIRKQVLGRISGRAPRYPTNWAKILHSKLPPMEMFRSCGEGNRAAGTQRKGEGSG